MKVLQASYRAPSMQVSGARQPNGILDHITKSVTEAFYAEVDKALAESPGGIVLGQPKLTQRDEADFYGGSVVVRLAATCESLPLPPEYRLMGGPADGHIVRTRGERTWLVPIAPPVASLSSYMDYDDIPQPVAEYERQGDTSVYFYKRTYNR